MTTETTPAQPPAMGEATGKQTRAGFASSFAQLPGFGRPDPNTFQTYRQMRANPTVALARIAAHAPIRSAEWSYESVDAGGLTRIDEAVKLIRTVMEKNRSKLLKHLLTGYDFGFAACEKVFCVDSGRIVIDHFKPLKVDITAPLEHKDTGALLGVKNGDVNLFEDKALLWSYDAEPGNHWGRSRHENIRTTAYHTWRGLSKRQQQYVAKVAGVIPMVEYEPGQYQDADGRERSAYEMAEEVLKNLGSGAGVAMPRTFSKWTEELIRSGANIGDLQAWSIRFLEASGAHGSDFVAQMGHEESLILRGWLLPERSVIEGKYGTKAEAGEHGDLAIAIAQLDADEIAELINSQVVDQLLELNYGPEYKGKVVIKAERLADTDKAFVRGLMSTVLSNPMNMDKLESVLDFDAAMDTTGLPKLEDVVNIDEGTSPVIPGQLDAAATLSRAYATVKQSDQD